MTTSTDTLTILSVVLGFLLIPIFVYASYNYYDKRAAIYQQQRSPLLTLTGVGCLGYWATVHSGLWIIYVAYPSTDHILFFLLREFGPVISFLVVSLFILEYWLLFFEVSWSIAIIDQEWQVIINPTFFNFFVAYKYSWGNFDWVAKRWVAVIALQAVITWTLRAFNLSPIPIFVCNFIWITAGLMIWLNMPNEYQDVYRVQDQVRYVIFVLYFILFLDGILNLLLYSNVLTLYQMVLTWHWFLMIGSLAILYLQTTWPLQMLIKYRGRYGLLAEADGANAESSFELPVQLSDEFSDTLPTGLPRSEWDYMSTTQRYQHYLESITKMNTFKLFLLYLRRAFRLNDLLFVIEISQVTRALAREQALAFNKELYLEFAESVPMSVIIESRSGWWLRYQFVYEKYVSSGTTLELNLSENVRGALDKVFDVPHIGVPNPQVFDGAVDEIHKRLFEEFRKFCNGV